MLMWSEKAPAEASSGWGQPVQTTQAPEPDGEPSVIVKQWPCGDGHIIARSRPNYEFQLSATCAHRVHHEMAQYPLLKVSDVALIDPNGKALDVFALPADARDYRLRFTVGPVVFQNPAILRVDSWPLPGGTAEEIRVGEYTGPQTYEVTLQQSAPGGRDLRLEVLDPRTAQRDWGANGVEIWRARVPAS